MQKYTGDLVSRKINFTANDLQRDHAQAWVYCRVHLSKFYKVRRKCEWEIEPPPRSKRKAAYQGSSLSLSA